MTNDIQREVNNQTPRQTPLDFFLHLLHIVALYASAASFSALIFQYVNLLIPDVASYEYFDSQNAERVLRSVLAVLIIMFPVNIITGWFLNKIYARHPEKRSLKIRRWLVYFTLFVASIVIMVDLIKLIQEFLNGELTLRFSLKVLAVLFVSGSIFTYYIWDIKKSRLS